MGNLKLDIIWHRRIDFDAHRKRMRRFWTFYALPAALIILVGGIVDGLGAVAGLLILLGLFGAMLFIWFWLIDRNERTNPVITREGEDLCWAKRRVPLSEVQRFTTCQSSTSVHTSGVTTRAYQGIARFLLADGEEVDFVFAELGEEQLGELRTALEGVLPQRWCPVDDLRNPQLHM